MGSILVVLIRRSVLDLFRGVEPLLSEANDVRLPCVTEPVLCYSEEDDEVGANTMKTRSVHVKESQLEPVVYSKLTLKPTLNRELIVFEPVQS